MAEKPIGALLFSMSLPAIFSMLIQALYNIVDTIYISELSEAAVFTMGLVYPMQIILISMALGGAIGAATLVARRLGQKNQEEANKTASTGLILAFFHWILCALIGIFLTKPFLALFTSDPQIIEMGYSYLSIVMTWSIGVYISIYFERIFQAQGNMIVPMIALLIGAITNIVLDPILIFGYFGFPALGIQGAALATITGQMLGGTFITVCMFVGKHEVKLQFRGLHLRWSRIKEIYAIGLPVTIMNAIGAFANMAMNAVVVVYSELAVSSLSLYFKLSSFVFMPIFGLNQGSLPILSFNYGAQDIERYTRTVKIYLATVLIIMGAGTLFFVFGTDILISIFHVSNELRELTRIALRILSLSFVFFGISIVMITVFQSVGKAFVSMMISVLRQMVLLVPLAYLLGGVWGLQGVWLAYPIAEIIVVIIFAPMCYKAYKQAFMKVKETE